VLHNRHIVDFLQRVSFPGGVQSATSGTKDQDANSFIFAMQHGFVINYVPFVMISLMTANDGRTS
jgi:hypothetical protein